MNIHTIECFLSVAKNLNFTRAAEERFISQSSMTAQINSLEAEVGTRLFIRTKRYVKLTAAGESLKKDFVLLLSQYEEALKKAREIAEGERSKLKVGYHGPVEWALLPEVISKLTSTYPEINFELNIHGWGELTNMLLDNTLDVIFIEKSEIENISEIESILLFSELSCIAVPSNHPLAKKKNVKSSDLVNEKVIMTNNESARISLSKIYDRLLKAGIDMKKAKLVPKYENAMAMVASGLAVSPIPRSFKKYDDSRITYVDIDSNEIHIDMSLAWLKSNTNPSIYLFADAVKKYFSTIKA